MKNLVIFALLTSVQFVLVHAAGAQVMMNAPSPTGGIVVTGKGEVIAKPDVVEIKLRVAGSAELTDDAIVKHRDARDRVLKAFEALKLTNLKTDESGLNVHPPTSRTQ